MTLTVAELSAALRLGDSAEETAEATRLLAFTTEAVTKHAPDAPDVAHNEAAIRLAGYLFDQPTAGRGAGYADSLRTVAPWRSCSPTACTGPGPPMPLDRRITVRVASEGTNDFGEPVTSTTDYPVWAMLVQDRLARNVEAGGAYALADRVWRVRFNQAFLDAHAAQGSLSVISAAGEDPDVVTGVAEPTGRGTMANRRRRFLDLLS